MFKYLMKPRIKACKQIFCFDCRYPAFDELEIYCSKTREFKTDWWSRRGVMQKCSIKNRNNDCKDYEAKV